jgi:hypothetical protein
MKNTSTSREPTLYSDGSDCTNVCSSVRTPCVPPPRVRIEWSGVWVTLRARG